LLLRILITGGAGFIGSHIAEECLKAGHEVFVLDNLSTGKEENLPADTPLYKADITDKEAVAKVFDAVKPQSVIHEAAQISVSRSVREPAFDAQTNIMGLLYVLEEAVKHKASSFIFASSGGVLYGDVFEPADENHALAPVSPYGISKLSGEYYLKFFAAEYAAEHALSCIALRYGNVYGPRQDPYGEAGVVAIFLERFLKGEAPIINGDGKYIRDYVYVKDVAQANLLALENQKKGFFVYNVGTGIGTDVNQLEQKLRQALEETRREKGENIILPPASYGPPRKGDLRSSLLNATKIKKELGWQPEVNLDEGLKQTAFWFKKNLEKRASFKG